MKLLILMFCIAAALPAQTATDSQLLLNEVRELRQELVLLFRLQIEESAMARATQRLDQAKAQVAALQQRRSNQAEEIRAMEAELERTRDQAEKERLPKMIAGLRKESENGSAVEQDAQSKAIEAETEFRTEQARKAALEAALDKLSKQLESAARR